LAFTIPQKNKPRSQPPPLASPFAVWKTSANRKKRNLRERRGRGGTRRRVEAKPNSSQLVRHRSRSLRKPNLLVEEENSSFRALKSEKPSWRRLSRLA